jgi:putative ABC transport system permease protein
VRLVSRNLHYDTSITGLPAAGRLRQVVDAESRPVPVPSQGLLLTRVLGERLGVDAGERLLIERKDGDRRTFELPVAGLVDDAMGMNAYLELDALARALGEEPMFSVALLEVEHPARDALLRALGEIPMVVMVSEQAEIREAIDAQTGDVMTIWTLIVVLFGAVIAIGVIYNNARIALSERGRDLATLRVLGYTRREISIILLGQLAIHTLLALPLGFVFGFGLATAMMSSVDPEQFRPLTIINPDTYAFASLVVIGSSLATALVIRRRLDTIDLVGALKARD